MSSLIKIVIHPCHQQDLIDKTKKFIDFWRDFSSNSVPSMKPGNVISKEDSENFNDFVKSLHKKCDNKYLSVSTIESECITYLDAIINSENDTDDHMVRELESLIKRLEDKVHQWIVIFPIDHLVLSNLNRIELGSDELVPFSQIEKEFGKIIHEANSNTSFGATVEEAIKKDFTDRVCLKVEVIAEEQNRYEDAWFEYESIINILRIFLSCYRNVELVKIGIGEDYFSRHILLSFGKNETVGYGISATNTRFKDAEFTLTPEILKELEEKYYFNELKTILSERKNRSKLQTQILLAIRWIGAAIHDDIESDKILKFAIALECLLISGKNQDNKSKSESLAERCAFLLEEVPSERHKIYREIKDLYNIRSDIVHEGDTISDTISVFKLMDLAIRCLFKVIAISAANTNMREIEDIITWVDKKKLRNYYGDSEDRIMWELSNHSGSIPKSDLSRRLQMGSDKLDIVLQELVRAGTVTITETNGKLIVGLRDSRCI